MDWLKISFICLMIAVHGNNCNEGFTRFRREHQVEYVEKNTNENMIKADQKKAKPQFVCTHKHGTTENGHPIITENQVVESKTKNKNPDISKSSEKREKRIKASIKKLPPSHPLSKAIKMMLEEKEEVKPIEYEKLHNLEGRKSDECIVNSDINSTATRKEHINEEYVEKEIKKLGLTETILDSPPNSTLLKINTKIDVDDMPQCENQTNKLANNDIGEDNESLNAPTLIKLNQKEDDDDGYDKCGHSQNILKESEPKIVKGTNDKDNYVDLKNKSDHKCTNNTSKTEKPYKEKDVQRDGLDFITTIDCEDHEYEEIYKKKPQNHVSDLELNLKPYLQNLNWNHFSNYYNTPKTDGRNYYSPNYGQYPYSSAMVEGGTILKSPNPCQQQWTEEFQENNINATPLTNIYRSNNFPDIFNINDLVQRAWKNRKVHIDTADMKNQEAIFNEFAPRIIGNWPRSKVNDDEKYKILFNKRIKGPNGIVNANKDRISMPNIVVPA